MQSSVLRFWDMFEAKPGLPPWLPFNPSYVHVLEPWYFELESSPPGTLSLQSPMVLCHGEATHIGKARPTKVTETWRGWSHLEPEGESSGQLIPDSSLSPSCMCVCVFPAHLCWASACKWWISAALNHNIKYVHLLSWGSWDLTWGIQGPFILGKLVLEKAHFKRTCVKQGSPFLVNGKN